MDKPDALAAYTVVLLFHEQRYLLLRRAETRHFAPGRWTGIGGRVERDELGDLRAAALRELEEETGITRAEISDFILRRVLLQVRPGEALTLLLYFTGRLHRPVLPPCTEGALAWVTPEEVANLDVIENTRVALPLLLADQQGDPQGLERVYLGIARFKSDGTFDRIVWDDQIL